MFSAKSRIRTGLPHVQHKQLAVFCHGATGQHQLAGFGDGHKIADDALVGECHRAAVGNLLFKEGDHRAGGAQYIAKASALYLTLP